jgi:hypothetical protein
MRAFFSLELKLWGYRTVIFPGALCRFSLQSSDRGLTCNPENKGADGLGTRIARWLEMLGFGMDRSVIVVFALHAVNLCSRITRTSCTEVYQSAGRGICP